MSNPFCDLEKLTDSAKALGHGNIIKGQEAMAWKNFEKAKAFYHVAPAGITQRILTAGLIGKPNGKLKRSQWPVIWFFTDDSTGHFTDMPGALAYTLALFWYRDGALAAKSEFSVFQINKSAIEQQHVLWDDVGEACAIASFGYSPKRERLRIQASSIRLVENRPIPSEWLRFSMTQSTPGVGSYKPNLKHR
jgi:hypothetical protein